MSRWGAGRRREEKGFRNTSNGQRLLPGSSKSLTKPESTAGDKAGAMADGHKYLANAGSSGTGRASTHLLAPPHKCSVFHVQLFWGEKKYTSKAKRFKAAHLNEGLLSLLRLAAWPLSASITWLPLCKWEGSHKFAPVFAPVFDIPVKSSSPIMWSTGMRDCSTQVTAGQVKGFSSSDNGYKEFETTQCLDLVLHLRVKKPTEYYWKHSVYYSCYYAPRYFTCEKRTSKVQTQQAHRQTQQTSPTQTLN